MGTSTAPPQTLSPPNPRLDAMAAAFASIMLAPAHPPPMFASLASSPAPSRVILQVMFFIFYPFLSSKLAALLSAPHRGTSVPRIWCPPPSLLPTWNPCLCPQNRTLMRHAGALGLDTPEETDIFSHLSWLCLARWGYFFVWFRVRSVTHPNLLLILSAFILFYISSGKWWNTFEWVICAWFLWCETPWRTDAYVFVSVFSSVASEVLIGITGWAAEKSRAVNWLTEAC
jgi:hypothetical protein